VSDTPVDPEDPSGVSVSIAASSDDWEQFGGATSNDLEFGLNGTQQQFVGLRFTGLNVPDVSDIAAAHFEFKAFESNAAAANFVIEVENSQTAATYTTANNPGVRSYLGDTIIWSGVEAWTAGETYKSPDIADLIRQVAADGLDPAEALGFRITGQGSRAANSFNFDGVGPKLVITFDDDGLV
jgi:hypothetical protein